MISSVLIVDDDEVFRTTMRNAFEKRKVRALTAVNAEAAMALFRENAPDLVLLDYRMPVRDGVSALREMHVYNPSPVFIMLTGFGSVPLAVEAMKEGADSFLPKPCEVETILTEAEKISEKKKRRIPGMDEAEFRSFNLNILERLGIEKALKATQGNVSKAAVLLGIDRRTLQRKMKRIFSVALWIGGLSLAISAMSVHATADDGTKAKTVKLMAITGDEEFGDNQSAWDRTYSRSGFVYGKDPSAFLVKVVDQLPKGRALDIATGEGRNAVFLAKKGFLVDGVDISVVGLRKAQKLAAEQGVKIQTVNADLNKYHIKPDHYTVILNFYYLQRNLFPQIKAGLKSGGVLVFETNTTEQLKNPGSSNWDKEFLLNPGELKQAFSDFEILSYSETNDGKTAIASLVAKKR